MKKYFTIWISDFADDAPPVVYYHADAAARYILKMLPADAEIRRDAWDGYWFANERRLANYLRGMELDREYYFDGITVTHWDY